MKGKVFKDHTRYLIGLKKFEFILIIVDLFALVGLYISNLDTNIKLVVDNFLNGKITIWSILVFVSSTFFIIKIIFSSYSFFHNLREFYRIPKQKNLKLIENDQYFKIKLSEYDQFNEAQKVKTANQVGLYYERLSEYIINADIITIEMNEDKPKEIKKLIKVHKDRMEKFLGYHCHNAYKEGKILFNKKKLCLSYDFDTFSTVTCHENGYFDSLLTNEIFGKYVVFEDEKIYCSAVDLLPIKSNGQLLGISENYLNNHIGVSTLALTKDNYIILLKQKSENKIEPNKFITSGSGSLDLKDRTKDNDFKKTIINGMERELIEELCNKQKKYKRYIKDTRIIGYYRWINRGGKPEFCGLTKLDCNLAELPKKDNQEVIKEVGNQMDNIYRVTQVDDIPVLIKKIIKNKDVSLSLLMTLRMLETYYLNHRQELESFIS